jgi:hypothetical protein
MDRRFKAGRTGSHIKNEICALKRKLTKGIFYVDPQRSSLCYHLYGTMLDPCFYLDVVEGATALTPAVQQYETNAFQFNKLKNKSDNCS